MADCEACQRDAREGGADGHIEQVKIETWLMYIKMGECLVEELRALTGALKEIGEKLIDKQHEHSCRERDN